MWKNNCLVEEEVPKLLINEGKSSDDTKVECRDGSSCGEEISSMISEITLDISVML